MSSTNAKATILPVELIRHIFEFLSPCEIVRLRQISKRFRDISLDPLLWRDTYARAPIPRPPGPFPWQSTLYLERTLVQSDLLSKTWLSQPAKLISREMSQWNLNNATWLSLVLGRWCVWREENNIYCGDSNTGTSKKVYDVSRGEESIYAPFIRTGRNGQRIYVVITDHGSPYQLLKLLELDVSADGLPEPKIWDLDPQHNSTYQFPNEEHQRYIHDPSPFLILGYEINYYPSVVLDLRTLGVYELPIFTGCGLDEFRSLSTHEIWLRTKTLVVPTRTHVIAFQVVHASDGSHVVIEAFVAPDPPRSRDFRNLRLTHQAVSYHEAHLTDGTAKPILPFGEASLLRNSVVDPITKSVNIKILYTSLTLEFNVRVSLLDLILPASSSSSSILPIHVRREHILQPLWFSWQFTASEDGYARGILVSFTEHPHEIVVRKFTIDASGDMCTAQLGEPSLIVEPPRLFWRDVVFDGATGKLDYFDDSSSDCQWRWHALDL